VIIAPDGTVYSPWTPTINRTSRYLVSFSRLGAGNYRTMLIGGAPGASGKLKLRTVSKQGSFKFSGAGPKTIATSNVQLVRGY